MKILVLTRYDKMGASSRLRFIQYFDSIVAAGHQITHQSLISDGLLSEKYKSGKYRTFNLFMAYINRLLLLGNLYKFDIIWVEKELFPWVPFWVENLFIYISRFRRIIIDYDDAVFHVYDRSPFVILKWFFGRKIDKLMALSDVVVVGNDYLAERATQAGARSVELLPTVIDINRYQSKWRLRLPVNKMPIVVWVGSPSTIKYLENIRHVLLMVYKVRPFVLRVVGAEFFDNQLVIDQHAWAEDTESQLIQQSDVGLMPLIDSEWERGKCGYKLIQYMACGLPVIASPIGVNSQIVSPGFNGFLAEDDEGWTKALVSLLENSVLAMSLGMNSRMRVEERYCLQVTAPKLQQFFELSKPCAD